MDKNAYNYEHAIEIAPKIWWVGYVIPDDPFQCHVYLIENGKDSILIDPGSKLTWEATRKKILEVIPLENLRYIICQHQDPDIASCIEDILKEIGTENRFVVTHWRTAALLKHYNWGIDFYEVDENNWKLKTKDRELEFVFTPYMHFAGNICTYDIETKTLFSSDIFGAFRDTFKLFADDPKVYYEQMKLFHTHYMPSRDIVNHGLDMIEAKDIEMIAPQHGSVIPKKMIPYLISRLRKLEVGIYLHFTGYKNVQRLTKANEILSKIFEQITFTTTTLYEKIGTILMLMNELFALERVVCLSSIDGKVVMFDSSINHPIEIHLSEKELFAQIEKILSNEEKTYFVDKIAQNDLHGKYFAFPFVTYNEHHSANGICYFLFAEDEIIDTEDIEILKNFRKLFSIMLMKEIGYYRMQKERNELLHKTITDGLTGLYNRYYLDEIAQKEFNKAKRHGYPLSAVMLDLDHFKDINDIYGHDVGDIILKDFARLLHSNLRESDFLFRYGGEEFLILMPFTSKKDAYLVVERIRNTLKQKNGVEVTNQNIVYSFSAGIAQYEKEKNVKELIRKSDELMYIAKKTGRDRSSLQ
ncbi:diguanylate cyclase [Nitrosophilus alvini]|uniref:diguanylate cyclase n=1 Tax=Nitrosophilus alvini TaxID=2714855 RepID=UPI00190D53E9|nr:diguanylate cyclase [Nitrosophilus alvini]